MLNPGTFVAGQIGATTNNGLGVAGAVPLISLYACQFIGAKGDGDIGAAVLCMNWCIANNVHVSPQALQPLLLYHRIITSITNFQSLTNGYVGHQFKLGDYGVFTNP